MTAYYAGDASEFFFLSDGIRDIVYAGEGNDRGGISFPGPATVYAGGGNDQVFLSSVFEAATAVFYGDAGDDALFGGGLADRLYGGDGNDLLAGAAAASASLDGLVRAALDSSTGDDVLDGGTGSDAIYGFGGNDEIYGGPGDDRGKIIVPGDGFQGDPVPANTRSPTAGLFGGAGDDVIYGGSGDDHIDGGTGRDRLYGGTGRDVFDFNAAADSSKGKQRDIIRDFDRGDDIIDLAGIDAKEKKDGVQSFKFIGQKSFHDKAGELRFKNGKLAGDTDGDGKADFEIGVAGIKKLVPDDLHL